MLGHSTGIALAAIRSCAGRAAKAALTIALSAALVSLTACGGSSGSGGFEATVSDQKTTGTTKKSGAGASDAGTTSSASKVARDAVAKLAASSTPGSAAYKIGPLDALEITVFKVPELSKVVQVADTGTVNLPLVGEIPAAGLTAQQIERDLTSRLGAKYLHNPQVTVLVKEYNSQRVTMEGAFKKPGVYPIQGRMSLLQAIALAGGIDDQVSSDEVVVFRQKDGKRSAGRFSISEIRKGTSDDPLVVQGDVVVVNTSDVKAAFNTFVKALPIASMIALF
jgi:polysaccharide export outer membrane protein